MPPHRLHAADLDLGAVSYAPRVFDGPPRFLGPPAAADAAPAFVQVGLTAALDQRAAATRHDITQLMPFSAPVARAA